jgi:hypothetical protein
MVQDRLRGGVLILLERAKGRLDPFFNEVFFVINKGVRLQCIGGVLTLYLALSV